ncbi:hypothetical protein ES702_02826 [subsurface metagenome]
MNEYKESFEDRILRIKGEFINYLRSNIEKRSDKNIAYQDVRDLTYRFIIDNVLADKEVKTEEEKKRLFIDLIIETIDFCLSYGGIILETLGNIRQYKDFEEIGLKEDSIDA